MSQNNKKSKKSKTTSPKLIKKMYFWNNFKNFYSFIYFKVCNKTYIVIYCLLKYCKYAFYQRYNFFYQFWGSYLRFYC